MLSLWVWTSGRMYWYAINLDSRQRELMNPAFTRLNVFHHVFVEEANKALVGMEVEAAQNNRQVSMPNWTQKLVPFIFLLICCRRWMYWDVQFLGMNSNPWRVKWETH